tara:strand:- start:79 stop:1317 length:1239 start_codon:yes stop_codon:yes gene_type:complete
MKKKDIQEVYCIGSIPVDTGQISLYDLGVKNIKKSLNERELVRSIINGKKISKSKDKGLNISCFADGAYPCYVVVDQNKLVKKILIELTNTCGWGSSLFNDEWRIKKLESELASKSKLPDDQQIDMIAGVRSSVDFSTAHRLTYGPWQNLDFAKDDKKFLIKKGNTKTKLFDLNISSEFLIIDDYPNINHADAKKIKDNKKKSDYDRFKNLEKFIYPVKKKNYPVYLYHSNKSKKKIIEDLKNIKDNDQAPPMFPILSIEGIENCRLQKSTDSSLILEDDKNKFRGASSNFWNLVDTMTENKITDFHLKICQLDFGDFTDLDVLKSAAQYSTVPKKLTLRHFRHIDNWKILHKFFDLKEIHFDNCKINLEGKKKNDWFDIMSKFYYNRKENKELNDKYGDLKVFVNGREVFD